MNLDIYLRINSKFKLFSQLIGIYSDIHTVALKCIDPRIKKEEKDTEYNQSCTHTYTHTRAHTRAHTHIHTRADTRIYIYTHTNP